MSRRNPFDEIERMFERLGGQFEQFETEMGSAGDVSLDVEDRGDEYVVTADLAGFDRNQIDVKIKGTTLQISAERDTDSEASDDESYIHRERSRSTVSRSIRLPERVDDQGGDATYRNGVLTVTLPKVGGEKDDGRDIPIN